MSIGRIDRRDIGLGQFGRGDFLGAQLAAGFGNGQAGEFAHRVFASDLKMATGSERGG